MVHTAGRADEDVRRELELAARKADDYERLMPQCRADASRLHAELDGNIAARTRAGTHRAAACWGTG